MRTVRPVRLIQLAAAAAVVVAVGGVGLPPVGAVVPPAADCTFSRITSSPDSDLFDPGIDDAGDLVVFRSDNDLTGDGAGERLYRYDVATQDLEALTEVIGPASHSLSGDGSAVVYAQLALDASEVRVIDLGTEDDDVLFDLGDGQPLAKIAVSGDGDVVALTSNADLVGGNADGGPELYRYRISTDDLDQLTDEGAGASISAPQIDGDGDRIVVHSTADLDGTNADGSREAFLWDATDGFSAVTAEPAGGAVSGVDIDRDGERVAFAIAHAASPAATKMATYDVTAGTTTELSFFTGASSPGIDPTGQAVYLTDIVPEDPIGGFISLYRVRPATNRQVIAESPDVPAGVPHDAAAGGRLIVMQVAGPAAVDDLFLADCASFFDVGHDNPFYEEIEWMFAAQVTSGFSDGTYRPDGSVTRAAMAAFMYRLAGEPEFIPPGEPSFTDVPETDPFFAEIEWLVDEGITTGFADGTYRPSAAVTRQAMSAFMYRLAGSPGFLPPGTPSFTDVPLAHVFFAEIEWMADEGITTGFAGGTYRPSAAVTRQAMAAFMQRLDAGPGVGV
jgi:hypothetical protein